MADTDSSIDDTGTGTDDIGTCTDGTGSTAACSTGTDSLLQPAPVTA